MRIFVDTSALYALLDQAEANHEAAQLLWRSFANEENDLIVSNYTLLETAALVQRRLGMRAVNEFHGEIAPVLEVEWVTEELHQASVAALLTANRRDLSLVDCVSFAACRRAGVDRVFAFDEHFAEQGFTLLRAQP